MKLAAHSKHDLDWLIDETTPSNLWELDFDFSVLNDSAIFAADALAIETFVKRIPKAEKVVLYRGSLDILQSLKPAEDVVEAASIFGDYLHRLASFLPDTMTPYCLFEDDGGFLPGRATQLKSKDRFWHLRLSLEENNSQRGILLPADEHCNEETLAELGRVLVPRVIPENRLNEMWDGLDELIIIENAVSSQGFRMLQGFEAAGGRIIRSRGI